KYTHIVGLLSIFLVPAITFLIILPGVRKHRLSSTFSFLFNMYVGATLLVSLHHPCWHRAETPISTSYKAFSNAKMDAYILVRVGLQYLNISLSNDNVVLHEGILYNERFSFSEVNKMEKELSNALSKGLPFPILKVIEYLSDDVFSWGRQYRVAGYYTASQNCNFNASASPLLGTRSDLTIYTSFCSRIMMAPKLTAQC
ncbi:unnamed protein product, partial [Cylicostephanus goldi]